MAEYTTVTTARTTVPDLAALVTSLRSAIAPEVGMVFLDPHTVQLKKTAPWTAAERSTAQGLIDAAADRDQAAEDVDIKVLKALASALWECIPAPLMTKAQLRNRAIAILKTL